MTNAHNPKLRNLMYSLVTSRMAAIQIEARDHGTFDGDEFALLYTLFTELAPPEDLFKVEKSLIDLGLLVPSTATFNA